MRSTEPETAPDCLFFQTSWPYFVKKRHPNFRERPFQPLIGDLMPFGCPEMTTFSNDTGRDILPHDLLVVRKKEAGKRAWRAAEGYSGDGKMVIIRGLSGLKRARIGNSLNPIKGIPEECCWDFTEI